jgi:hypothetical protein
VKTRFHALLEAKILEVIASSEAQIAGGNCKSFEAYQNQVGYISGLRSALLLAESIELEMQ